MLESSTTNGASDGRAVGNMTSLIMDDGVILESPPDTCVGADMGVGEARRIDGDGDTLVAAESGGSFSMGLCESMKTGT